MYGNLTHEKKKLLDIQIRYPTSDDRPHIYIQDLYKMHAIGKSSIE